LGSETINFSSRGSINIIFHVEAGTTQRPSFVPEARERNVSMSLSTKYQLFLLQGEISFHPLL
jgi:hypothetical protein